MQTVSSNEMTLNPSVHTKLTNALLVCGMIAGPFYIVVGLIQALTRPGFDILRHDLSLLATGNIGFLTLIAASVVMARRFASQGHQGWAAYSLAAGMLFFAAFIGVAMGSGQSWSVIGFWIGVVFIWAWISILAARLRKESNA